MTAESVVELDTYGGRNHDMYSFKHAVRVETDNNWSRQLSAILQEPLPPQATFEGENVHGKWFKVKLPASVWALAVKTDSSTTVGVYHSPYAADFELKEALNGSQKKTKV